MEKDMKIAPQNRPGIFCICPDKKIREKTQKFSISPYGPCLVLRPVGQSGKGSVQIGKIGVQLILTVLEDPETQIFPAFFVLHFIHLPSEGKVPVFKSIFFFF